MSSEQQTMTIQAAFDQFGALLRDMAPHIATYYKVLLAEGLDEDIASSLTWQLQGDWLDKLLNPAKEAP